MPKDAKQTFLEVCDTIPPCLVRAMAMCERRDKTGKRLMTNSEIAEKGRLSQRMVQRISASKSWADIRVDSMTRYLRGCGIIIGDVDVVNREWLQEWLELYADLNFPHISDSRIRKQLWKLMDWGKPT